MPKILVADLFGTLIPDTIIVADYLYGNGVEKSFDDICNDKNYHSSLMDQQTLQCVRDLDKFLEEGNDLFIVTDLSAHDTDAVFILEEIIKRFRKYSSSKFQVYMVEKDDAASFRIEDLQSKITSNYVDNDINYIIYDGYTIGLVNKKEEVFNSIIKKYDLDNVELFSIGNSSADIPMIVKCMELGGKGSLLHYVLYTNDGLNKTKLNEVIVEKIAMEYYLLYEKQMLEQYPDFSKMGDSERLEIQKKFMYSNEYWEKFGNFREKREKELYDEVRKGNLTLDQLIKEDLIFHHVTHATHYYLEKKTLTENNWDKIDMYSTFREYYNRVLSIGGTEINRGTVFTKIPKTSKED